MSFFIQTCIIKSKNCNNLLSVIWWKVNAKMACDSFCPRTIKINKTNGILEFKPKLFPSEFKSATFSCLKFHAKSETFVTKNGVNALQV